MSGTTLYPSAIDGFTTVPDDKTDDTATAGDHAVHHNNLADAIVATQTALGVNPAGLYPTVAEAILNKVDLTPGASQTIQASADVVGLIVRAAADQNTAHVFEMRLVNNAIAAYIDKDGNFSAQQLLIAGVALNSGQLSDGAQLAHLASPAFTGSPTAPTPTGGDSSTAIATTAFVAGALAGGIPTAVILPYGGLTAPGGYLLSNGTANGNRATHSNLFDAITFQQPATTVIGLNLVSGLTDTSVMFVGMPIEGSGIPAGATISSIFSGTQVTLSAVATASGSITARFFPYGNGNGSTTFNTPDGRDRTLVGVGSGLVKMRGKNEGLSAGSRTMAHSHTVNSHTHDIAHSHSLSASTGASGASTDGAGSHSHGGGTGGGGAHSHSFSTGGPNASVQVVGTGAYGVATNNHSHSGSTSGVGDHSHGISSDGFHSHNVSAHSHDMSHSHTLGSTASGAASPLTDAFTIPHLGVNFIIKT